MFFVPGLESALRQFSFKAEIKDWLVSNAGPTAIHLLDLVLPAQYKVLALFRHDNFNIPKGCHDRYRSSTVLKYVLAAAKCN